MRQRTKQHAGPGLPQTADQRIHWRSYFNVSGETVPPFAAMEMGGAIEVNGDIAFIIQKPGAGNTSRPDHLGFSRRFELLGPEHIMFNGSESCLPDNYGRGTFDLPASALMHEDQLGGLLSTRGVWAEETTEQIHLMPREDEWSLSQTSEDGFVAIGLHAPFGSVQQPGQVIDPVGDYLAVVITRGNSPRRSSGAFMRPAQQTGLQPGAIFINTELGDNVPTNVGGSYGGQTFSSGLIPIQQGLRCLRPGLYLVGFCGTVSAMGIVPEVPDGAALIVQAAVQDLSDPNTLGTPTNYSGWRRHNTDTDSYGLVVHKGAENIAFQGRFNLEEDHIVQLYNSGAYAYWLTSGYIWAEYLGKRLDF